MRRPSRDCRRWQREPRGAVEGINNKARVITKRCYGVKSADPEVLVAVWIEVNS